MLLNYDALNTSLQKEELKSFTEGTLPKSINVILHPKFYPIKSTEVWSEKCVYIIKTKMPTVYPAVSSEGI